MKENIFTSTSAEEKNELLLEVVILYQYIFISVVDILGLLRNFKVFEAIIVFN